MFWSARSHFVLLLIAIWGSGLVGQDQRQTRFDRSNRISSETNFQTPPVPQMAAVLDAPMDDQAYRVGAGDLFAVSIGTAPPQVFSLNVTVDGTLVIPMVGEVKVGGQSLAKARLSVVETIRQKFKVGEPSAALLTPRKIVVRVRGRAVIEGSYVISASDRVQTLLSVPGLRREVMRRNVIDNIDYPEPMPIARRSIVVIRSTGESVPVDLERFEITGASVWNPYLQEGDEVVFPEPERRTPTVSVGGAVYRPGTFEWKSGDRVGDLISFARGPQDHAILDSVLLTRYDGATLSVPMRSTLEVQPGDRIVVRAQTPVTVSGLVTVEGEVQTPGQYPIEIGRTRVADIITAAGGLTKDAMIHAGAIYRTPFAGSEMTLLRITGARGSSAVEDTTYINLETEARAYGEPVSANLRSAVDDPHSADNAVLQPGDRIVIPRRTGTVYVFGQVVRPGHVAVQSGGSAEDYIRLAGGFTDRAKTSEAMVIKRASRQWLGLAGTTVEEGDFIWVPREVDRDLVYDLSAFAQVAAVISAAATLVLVVWQISQ